MFDRANRQLAAAAAEDRTCVAFRLSCCRLVVVVVVLSDSGNRELAAAAAEDRTCVAFSVELLLFCTS